MAVLKGLYGNWSRVVRIIRTSISPQKKLRANPNPYTLNPNPQISNPKRSQVLPFKGFTRPWQTPTLHPNHKMECEGFVPS